VQCLASVLEPQERLFVGTSASLLLLEGTSQDFVQADWDSQPTLPTAADPLQWQGRTGASGVILDEQTRNALEALGYLQGEQ